MSSDLQEKLADVAVRLTATGARLQELAERAAALRAAIAALRREEGDRDASSPDSDWDHRVPTRPIAERLEEHAGGGRRGEAVPPAADAGAADEGDPEDPDDGGPSLVADEVVPVT
jgi:hypothetical protein